MNICKIEIDNLGGAPICTHNYPCPVYYATEHAIFEMDKGHFTPSWKARKKGWQLVKADNWFKRKILNIFFGTDTNIPDFGLATNEPTGGKG